jgi:hypothetical protein
MKAIYLMMLLGLAGASVSCRVNAPLDPHTMKPSCKCCPQNFGVNHPSSCHGGGGGVIVTSK